MVTKECSACRKIKPINDFYFLKKQNCYTGSCKKCCKDRTNARKQKLRKNGFCGCGRKPIEGKKLCRKCTKAFKKAYHSYKKHDQRYMARLRANSVRLSRKLKEDAFKAYGGAKCTCCEETHFEFLTIDHLNNPVEGVPRSGKSFYGWLKKHGYPPGYRVLCLNCNFSYGHYGYCPHKTQPSSRL